MTERTRLFTNVNDVHALRQDLANLQDKFIRLENRLYDAGDIRLMELVAQATNSLEAVAKNLLLTEKVAEEIAGEEES